MEAASERWARSLERHLAGLTGVFLGLGRSGRSKSEVLAVLAAETYFRGWDWRLAEYAAWMLLGFIWPARSRTLSVGLAQVHVEHWYRLGFIRSMRPTLQGWLTFTGWEANYDVCDAYLHWKLGYDSRQLERIAAVYRGEVRRFHLAVLRECYRYANHLIEKAARRSSRTPR